MKYFIKRIVYICVCCFIIFSVTACTNSGYSRFSGCDENEIPVEQADEENLYEQIYEKVVEINKLSNSKCTNPNEILNKIQHISNEIMLDIEDLGVNNEQ